MDFLLVASTARTEICAVVAVQRKIQDALERKCRDENGGGVVKIVHFPRAEEVV